jgi:transcriptional regulator with XRE-family HTH domain
MFNSHGENHSDSETAVGRSMLPADVAANVRAACAEKGWNLGQLARQARVSRTTLYLLERGKIGKPHVTTLSRLAAALEVPPERLMRSAMPHPRAASIGSAIGDCPDEAASRTAFDRSTNPLVAEVHAESPGLFAGWSAAEWDELYSTFGTGGALTRQGVVETAEHISRKRETVRQLQVLLETHLGAAVARMVESLYEMVAIGGPAASNGRTTEPTE